MNKNISLIVLLAIFSISTLKAQTSQSTKVLSKEKTTKMPLSHMAQTAKLIGPAISDPNWYNWCVSPIKGKDGKIHIFGSRWPAKEQMDGWMGKNAEIAHFVSDKPEGPFKYVSTVLKSSDFPHPDKMWAPHNPRIEYVDGKYILLYIFQTQKDKALMYTGMMIADDINGPWRFAGKNDGLMVENSKDPKHWTYGGVIGTDNPAFMKIGKKYYIYFKSGMPTQRTAKYGYAVADNLEGPYTLSDHPITDNIDYIEDAMAFKVKNEYFLLTTDNYGTNSGTFGNIILWKSKTGLDFKLADAKVGMRTILDYWGTPEDHKKLLQNEKHFEYSSSGKLERPAVLLIDGIPAYFYASAGLNVSGGENAETYVFKIDWANGN
ncbi:hypothetical protein BD847_2937 [Flavobacterium cutihirudinis]|uniref:Glycosyl hydrolase family 43 n=1 Tax=Flavobacterium cutihirudinis TaxID=1265740 RepID=A0A3D9FTA5_9FLAO|nr:glycoside hydrolase family protein [Flavobacterium cutihirudinis]RED23863.1 hypothetical protein BD847_2937 [Flavobacterium cutihirudinis]